MFGTNLYQGLEPLFLREGVGNFETSKPPDTRNPKPETREQEEVLDRPLQKLPDPATRSDTRNPEPGGLRIRVSGFEFRVSGFEWRVVPTLHDNARCSARRWPRPLTKY